MSPEKVEELVHILRTAVPRGLPTEFRTTEHFYSDFEAFKAPLIAYLSDKVEEAVRTVPEDVSEEFAEGYLDGAISLIKILANLQLEKNT